MNFDNFQMQNEFPKQLSLERQMKKMGSFVWFSCLLPELWSLNCQELCFFCNFFAYVSKKPTADIAIYVYVSKSSRFALLDR